MNDIMNVIEAELKRFAVPRGKYWHEAGGAHMRIVVDGPLRKAFMPYSTRAHGRGIFNFRADFRRFLRTLGYEKEVPTERLGDFGEAMLEAASRSEERSLAITVLEEHTAPQTPSEPTASRLPPKLTLNPVEKKKVTNNANARSTLNNAEVAHITMLITTNATVDFDKKVCTYKPAWNDERIWRMIATGERKHLTVENVIKLRKQVFGRTPEEIEAAKDIDGRGGIGHLWRAIRDLQERVEALEAATTEPSRPSNGTAHASQNQ